MIGSTKRTQEARKKFTTWCSFNDFADDWVRAIELASFSRKV
jgi:hypothetical protein